MHALFPLDPTQKHAIAQYHCHYLYAFQLLKIPPDTAKQTHAKPMFQVYLLHFWPLQPHQTEFSM